MSGSEGLADASATRIRALIDQGEASAVEVTRACIARIERTEPHLQAWAHTAPERALTEAAEIDRARARGERLAPLAGVPCGIKDIFNTRDMPTEMGSPIWKGFTPGNDARVVFSWRQAGAVALGKTATAEFAVHALGETRNPQHPERTPGTSSTGSAVAVASGQVPVALGTQTAGSIVRPASYCGVYGCKPSFGLLPRTGMLKTTDTLDSVGFFARTAADLKLLFEVSRVRGRDYPISNTALSDEARQQRPAGRPWRLLVAKPASVWPNTQPYARDAFEALLTRWAAAGTEVELVEAPLPESINEVHALHALIYEKTLAYYFSEESKTARLISPVFHGMIERGNSTTLAEYKRATARQDAISQELDRYLVELDLDAVVTLSVAGEPPLRHAPEPDDSCLVWTFCGLPVVGAPALTGPSGLPVGVQLAARRYNDYRLFALLEHLSANGLVPDAPNPALRVASPPTAGAST